MVTSEKKERVGEIEFWRMVFCAVIFIYHVGLDSTSEHTLFVRGQIGVELFFILSGLFMAKSADMLRSKNPAETKALGRESMKYVIKKYISFFPYHVFAFVCGFAIRIYMHGWNGEQILSNAVLSIPQFFLIHMGGLTNNYKIVSVEWYISSMLIAMLLIYPLLRKFYDEYVHIAAPLLSLSIMGWALAERGTLLGMYEWCGITTWGVLRAILAMNLGCIVYELAKYLKGKNWSVLQQIFLTLAGLSGYVITLMYANFTLNRKIYFVCLFLLMGSVAVSFSGVNLYGKYMNGSFFRHLGKLSLPFYLNTNIVRFILKQFDVNTLHYRYFIVIAFVLNLILSEVLLLIVDRGIRRRKRNKCKTEYAAKADVCH